MDEQHVCGVHVVLAALKSRPDLVEEIWVSDARGDKRMAAVLDAARAAHEHRFHRHASFHPYIIILSGDKPDSSIEPMDRTYQGAGPPGTIMPPAPPKGCRCS